MIDNRKEKYNQIEIDSELQKVSDSDVMLEFSEMLKSIYPHLIKSKIYCGDTFDQITENLYFDFVYSLFSAKYGFVCNRNEVHKYGFNLHRYKNINHIELNPINYPIKFEDSKNIFSVESNKELNEKAIIFIQFGDNINFLSGDADQVNPETVNFDLINFVIVEKMTGLNFRNQESFWASKNLFEFNLILEDYDKKEHAFYKNIFADE